MSEAETTIASRTDPPIALSVVIPCYRDENGMQAIFDRLAPVLDAVDGEAELILVDDGSPDRTGERAIALAEGYRHPVTVVRLLRNFGQHPAVFAGLAHARGRVVVTMDSDLQYPPEEIPKLVDGLSDGTPVVSGYRADRQDRWIRRHITRQLTRWLNRRTKANLVDFGSMFRAYDRAIVDRMLQVTERHRYVPAVVAWLGVPIKEVPIVHHARGEQGSRYRWGALLEMLLDLVTGYAIFPLRVVTGLGLFASVLGFIGTVLFLIYRVAAGAGPSGTISAFALIFFLSAVQLAVIALIGEYVGRIYTEAKARPYYLVGEVVRSGAAGEEEAPRAAQRRPGPAQLHG
jgi:undecaprenyl-phosphate 4-deoxy-4-formamido-L-arabinose transferase